MHRANPIDTVLIFAAARDIVRFQADMSSLANTDPTTAAEIFLKFYE